MRAVVTRMSRMVEAVTDPTKGIATTNEDDGRALESVFERMWKKFVWFHESTNRTGQFRQSVHLIHCGRLKYPRLVFMIESK